MSDLANITHAPRHRDTSYITSASGHTNCIHRESSRPPGNRADERNREFRYRSDIDRIAVLEHSLKIVEERYRHECSETNIAEKRAEKLEAELKKYQQGELSVCGKDSETLTAEVKEDAQEKQTAIKPAHAIVEQSRIKELKEELNRTQANLSCVVEASTDRRIKELEQEVKRMQGQLALQKAAVQVEQSKLDKITEENRTLRLQLDQQNVALRAEKLKTRTLADREAERSNKVPEERVLIAQEKLRVLSEALTEEREKYKKLKESLAATRAQLNVARKEANERNFVLELQLAWQERARGAEQVDHKRVKDQLSLAHALIESKRERLIASHTNSV